MTPETILNAAIGVMAQRGRSYGTYIGEQGEVCVLGALALAAGTKHDRWEELSTEREDEWAPGDAALVEAARKLLTTLPIEVDLDDLPIEDLVYFIGRWHDGVWNDEGAWVDSPTNAQVYEALAKAALLAERAGVRA